MRERWKDLTSAGDSGAVLNVAHWLSRATFDVIGLAGTLFRFYTIWLVLRTCSNWFIDSGFDYEFNAIKEENEKIYLAYKFQ